MLDPGGRAGAQQAHGGLDVHPQGALGVGIAFRYKVDGGKMINDLGLQLGQDFRHALRGGQVHLNHSRAGQITDIGRHAVPVIKHHQLFIGSQQLADQFIPDKTQTAGNNIHISQDS